MRKVKTVEELKQILADTEKEELDYPEGHTQIIKIKTLKQKLKIKIGKISKLEVVNGRKV